MPPFRIQVNNRKVVEGFYRGLGLDRRPGRAAVASTSWTRSARRRSRDLLVAEAGADPEQAKACLALASIQAEDASFAERVLALGARHPLLDEGLTELVQVVEAARGAGAGNAGGADLRIARGLDYYTGTVFETLLAGHEDLGSICSGGRYDALASDGDHTYPGVGISFGVSRLVSRLVSRGLVRATRAVPTCVVVALPSEDARVACAPGRGGAARDGGSRSRSRRPRRSTASRSGTPTGAASRSSGSPQEARRGGGHEVRDIRSGEQVPADPGDLAAAGRRPAPAGGRGGIGPGQALRHPGLGAMGIRPYGTRRTGPSAAGVVSASVRA